MPPLVFLNTGMMVFQLEVIAFDLLSCSLAEACGAHRIELCANPMEGGTSPSPGMIREARKASRLQLFPIIRPRGGDFLYSDDEFRIMQADIAWCKSAGCDGVVLGILNPDGSVDQSRTTKLVELAYPMDVTFHRAFDKVRDPFVSLEAVISTGCTRILTSGLQDTAAQGASLIQALIRQAGGRITIMPGSGIRSGNIRTIAKTTGAREFHSSARKQAESDMQFRSGLTGADDSHATLDPEEVRRMHDELKSFFGSLPAEEPESDAQADAAASF
jgi:copper homeostasis protein